MNLYAQITRHDNETKQQDDEKEEEEEEEEDEKEKDVQGKDEIEANEIEADETEKDEREEEKETDKAMVQEDEKVDDEKVEDDKVENEKIEDEKVEDEKVEDEIVEDEKEEDEKVENEKIEKVEDENLEDGKVEDEKVEAEKIEDRKEEDKEEEEDEKEVKEMEQSNGSSNNDTRELRPELREKVVKWLISFYHLDPRYKLLTFFNTVAREGADNIIFDDSPEIEESKELRLLRKYAFGFRASSILTVWRPCSNDAIRKMMEGTGVGKGLDIKGKSARKGILSGFVPFVQIHCEEDKLHVSKISIKAKLRCYYSTFEARQEVLDILEPLVEQLEDDYDDILEEKDRQALGRIKLHDKYKAKGWYGLEVSQRLFWKAYITDQNISRDSDTETGRPSMAGFQDHNLKTLKLACNAIPKPSPMPVVIQHDKEQAMSPQCLLMAYEENGTVKPVVSDFDGFLSGWRREALWFGCNIPREQEDVMMWCVDHIESLLENRGQNSTDTWTQQWLEQLKKEPVDGVHPEMPEYGYGDPKSYSLIEKVALRLIDTGAVRHGPESFNYVFPQEIDDYFLVISDTFSPVPWKYVNVKELQSILSEKIAEGFVFPLNPKWILCDPGWKKLYDELMASKALYADLSKDVWFPPHTGIREKIDAICEKFPHGFQQDEILSNGLVAAAAAASSRDGRGRNRNSPLRQRTKYSPLRTSVQMGMKLSGKAAYELAQLELEKYLPEKPEEVTMRTPSSDATSNSSDRQEMKIHGNLFGVKNEGSFSDKYSFVEHIHKGRSGLISKVKLRKSRMAGSALLTQSTVSRVRTFSTRKLTKHIRDKIYYAAKIIDLDRIESSKALENLKKDIMNLNSLDHPNIARLHDVYIIDADMHLVMDYCVCGVNQRYPETEKEVASIIKQVLSALKYMHERGVFHQDLKVKSVAYCTNNDEAIQLINFGLSVKYFTYNGKNNRVEDMYFSPPEVVQGKPYTSKCDLWSLGVIMYELLSRTRPFPDQILARLKEKILRGDYDPMKGELWQEVSQEAKDMISSLLVIDPDRRLDAVSALNHDWIKKMDSTSESIISEDEQKKVADVLSKYTRAPALQRIALNVIAHGSTMQDIVKLRQMFQEFDRDNDGIISMEELSRGLKKSNSNYTDAEIEDIFKSIDIHGTGQILYTEFLGATILVRGTIEEERITDAFDKLDLDKSGYITRENLKQALDPTGGLEAIIDEIMDEVCPNKDGKISYQKFRKCFRIKTSDLAFEVASVRRPTKIKRATSIKVKRSASIRWGRKQN